MFFVLSKIFSAMTQPLFWLSLWWIAAMVQLYRRRPYAVGMLWAGLGVFWLLGFQVLPDALIRPLENRYTAPRPEALSSFAGVVVLGGATGDALIYLDRRQVPLAEAAERLVESANLLRKYPHMQLVFSGGEAKLIKDGINESDLARVFYADQGLDMSRIRLESSSRNTRENAQLATRLIGAGCKTPWLLMTSASHMLRAMAEFEAVGCNVTPYPVDYMTADSTMLTAYSLSGSLDRWQVALHESIGLAVYRWTR